MSKKHQPKPLRSENSNCIELKITHVLPKYEDLKSIPASMYDGKMISVWKDEGRINLWIASTVTIFPVEEWDEIKKELMAMIFADRGKSYNDNPE